ncbi:MULTISPECIES: AAA family ATPase [Halobacterium]|uniref:AAA-type ATPase (MoxR subfamily) n=7 Tax=Halobacterium salinarum TaxID=2242 RepID=Q9HSH7_HALSA|nr:MULTISPECIES: AAA family ATPase [Halobacterium]AAG18829.1 methanol dehydrogenase regulatory protein [Halobacterium salinarum NRC-1]MBB6090667.1 MoxR-like ATPase [Halobacterium salinarum]MCF2207151.1 AAA family ATPase [Halobacterium salinarum]MDL0120199.1 AAA family ATPase [Halobacterium salinarum]MDL0123360.1 AAA family ATPase [Halobacterium salinarum]
MDASSVRDGCSAVVDEVAAAVIADREFLETVLVGFLADGHVLLEDVPGTGKTLTARSVATALGLEFSRVQFTPDLLPTDVLGTHVFNERSREFEFRPGPVFANVVLADEINRAPPKTQAALLEAMEEGQVTIDGETMALPEPFFVIATQNPVDQEGTFPLPEAQLDRFVVSAAIGYPDAAGERELLARRASRDARSPTVDAVLDDERVRALRRASEDVRVGSDLREYMVAVARATREHPRVEVGVSPRGTQRLFEAARARAVVAGREYVVPADVKGLAGSVLAHRLVLTPDAAVENVAKGGIVEGVLDEVPVPTVDAA